MDINIVSADFKFVGSHIKKIDVRNKLINFQSGNIALLGLDSVVVDVRKQDDSTLVGEIILSVDAKIGDDTKNEPYISIDYEIEGCFESVVEMDEQEFTNMLYINGGAALYSIARADILTLSSMTLNTGAVRLPLVNMYELMKEKNAASDADV